MYFEPCFAITILAFLSLYFCTFSYNFYKFFSGFYTIAIFAISFSDNMRQAITMLKFCASTFTSPHKINIASIITIHGVFNIFVCFYNPFNSFLTVSDIFFNANGFFIYFILIRFGNVFGFGLLCFGISSGRRLPSLCLFICGFFSHNALL